MKSKIVLIFILLFNLCHISYASWDPLLTHFNKHISITGGSILYTKHLLLWDLSNKIAKEQFEDSVYIKIFVNVDSYYYINKAIPIKPNYSLSYNDYLFENVGDQGKHFSSSPVKRKAIILHCNTPEINIQECLKLLYYGLRNPDSIIIHQQLLLAKTEISFLGFNNANSTNIIGDNSYGPHYNFIFSIPSAIIDEILSKDEPRIIPYLKQKYHRRRSNIGPYSFGKVDYYTQNDSFYLYEVHSKLDNNTSDHASYNEIVNDTAGETLLAFKTITGFASDEDNNYLIFDNDTLYHFKLKERQLSHPLIVPGLTLDGSITNGSFIYKNNKGNFVIPFDTWFGKYDVIYNADEGKLWIDSSSFSQGIFKEINQQKKERQKIIQLKQEKEKIKREHQKRQYPILGLLAVMIIANLYLIRICR